jgi:hypothetical protein
MDDTVTEAEAERMGLIQLTTDAMNTPKEMVYLEKEITRIMQDKTRKAAIVKKGIYLALWVDDAAERLSKIKSGAYSGI